MSQPTLNALNNTQDYLNQFKEMDKENLGYLNVAQVKDYFKSHQLPEDDLNEIASHSNQGYLTSEQFAAAMKISQMKKNGDVEYYNSSTFSSLLRHCEEALKLVERDRKMTNQTNNKDKLLDAFKELENFIKHFLTSLDEQPKDNLGSLNESSTPSSSEKMPGSFDFGHAANDKSTKPNARSMASSTSNPVYMKNSSFGDIPDESISNRNEKEPSLDSPSAFTSPLPQMNDAAVMSSSKPIFGGNLNGDAVGPNNDSYRSNVLESLRSTATDDINDGTEFNDKANKEREILKSSADDNAMNDFGVNKNSQNITPHTFHNQSNAAGSTFNPELAYTNRDSENDSFDKEQAVAALAAASIGTAVAVSASRLSDPQNNASNLDTNLSISNNSPFNSANKSNVSESYQGGLGGNDLKPFIKNAKDTELRPEDQPSFAAKQEKLGRLNGTDDLENPDNRNTFNPDNINKSDNLDDKNKPYAREEFQGGLGGDGTEPYIKNEKDTLLKPEDQPSFAAEQEKLNILNSNNEDDVVNNVEFEKIPKDVEQVNMSKPFEGISKSKPFVRESFQDGLRSNDTETYIKNENNSLLQPEGQPSFGAEQERLSMLNSADNDRYYNESSSSLNDAKNNYVGFNESNDTSTDLSQTLGNGSNISHSNISSADNKDSVPNTGSTLSTIGAGATGVAGAAGITGIAGIAGVAGIAGAAGVAGAAVLGLSGHDDDLNSNRDIDADVNFSNTSNNISASHNVYSPSLTSDNNFENVANADLQNAPISDTDIISNEALSDIADKVDADIGHNALTDNSIDEDGVISSNALDEIADNVDIDIEENAIPISAPLNLKPKEEVNVLVDRDTSLPSNIDNEVDIETANNASNRSPLDINTIRDNAITTAFDNNRGESITSDLNNEHIGGSSAIQDNADKNIQSATTDNASNGPSSRSLSSKEDSHSDDENKPGFFGKVMEGISKTLEPVSKLIPAISNDSTTETPSSSDVNNNSAKFNASDEPEKHGISDTSSDIIEKSNEDTFSNSNTNVQDIDIPKVDTHVGGDLPDLNDAFDKILSGDDEDKNQIDKSSDINAEDGSDLKRFDAATEDETVASPRVEGGTNTQSSNDNATSTPPFSGALDEITTVVDGIKGNLDRSLNNPISYEASPTGLNMESGDIDHPKIDTGLDKSIDKPEIDSVSTHKGTNIDEDVDGSGLSSSLGQLSSSLKSLKSNIDGHIGDSTSHVDTKLPFTNTASSNPNANISEINENPDGSFKPDLNKSTARSMPVKDEVNIDADADRSGLSSSLNKLSAGLKSLKNDISTNTDSSINNSDTNTEFPSLNANLEGSGVNQPLTSSLNTGVGSDISSVDADQKGPKFEHPDVNSKFDGSVNTPDIDNKISSIDSDVKGPDTDDKFDRSMKTPETVGKVSSIDDELKSPEADFNSNVEDKRSGLSGSLGKSPSSFKDLKNNISDKFDGSVDTPKQDSELSSFDAGLKESNVELPEFNSNVPSVDTDSKASKFDNPSLNATFGGSINAPVFEGKAPSLDADLTSPNVNLSQIDSKPDKSITNPIIDMQTSSIDSESPKIEANMKSPKANLEDDENADRPEWPNSFGKLSSSFKGNKDDNSGKYDNSVDASNVNKKLPSPNTNLKSSNVRSPDADDKFGGSIDTPNVNKELPDVDDKSKGLVGAPDIYKVLPDVDDKFGGSIDTSNVNKELPNVDNKSADSTDTPNVNKELPDVNDKSEGFVGAPDIYKVLPSIEGSNANSSNIDSNFDGKTDTPDVYGKLPSTDGKLPPIKGDLKPPNTGFNTNINVDDTGLSSPLAELSADLKGMRRDIAGTPDDSTDTRQIDGDYPSINAAVKGPNVGSKLSSEINASGFDSSVSTPDTDSKIPSTDSNLKDPQADLDTNENTDHSGLTGTFGKLTSGFVDLKNNITGKFNGSADSPNVDAESPSLNADVKSFNVGSTGANLSSNNFVKTSDNDRNIGGSITTPKADVDVPDANANFDGPIAPLHSPRLSLDKLSANANVNPDDSIKSPKDVDVPESNFGAKGPRVNAGSTGLDSSINAEASNSKKPSDGISTDLNRSKTDDSVDRDNKSTSFFGHPITKITQVISSFAGDDEEVDDDKSHEKKTETGYDTLRTTSRSKNLDDLPAMLDDITENSLGKPPSESDVNPPKLNKEASTSRDTENLNPSESLSSKITERSSSPNGDKPRSFISDSRFKELPAKEDDATEYSTPVASPIIPSTSSTDKSSTLDKMDGLESDVKKQLDAMSASVGQAPQVPTHKNDELPSPPKSRKSSHSLQSTTFHDHSAADAIKSVIDKMTSKLTTGTSKSGNDTDDRVLKVRDGFGNFSGFGVKCVSDNEDERAPSST